MQTSLYTLVTKDFTLAESLEMAVKAGFPAVDLRQGRSAEDTVHLAQTISDAEAQAVRAQVEATGLAISGLTSYYSLGRTDPAEARVNLEGLRRSFALARILGTPRVRCSGVLVNMEAGYETAREAFRRQVEEIAADAAATGVTLTIEQHGGTFFSSAGQILDMLRGVGNEYIGIVYDPGNCLSEGFERPSVQVHMLAQLIKAVHVKNYMPIPAEAAQETLPAEARRLDQGLLDYVDIVARLRAVGFDGYLTLEDFYGGFASVQEKLDWDAEYLNGLAAG
jgi:sugar phosphate isomerase/epimerase